MPIFLQYDGIDGEVTAEGHDGWIDVHSFQWGVGRSISTPTGSGKDRNTSAPQVSEVTLTKPYDGASVAIFQELLTPGEARKATIDFVRTDKDQLEVFLSLKLDEVMISGYHMSSGGDGQPLESLTLNFTKIEVTETGTTQTGASGQPTTAGYDLAKAAPM